MRKLPRILLGIAALCVSFWIGKMYGQNQEVQSSALRAKDVMNPLINPLLACQFSENLPGEKLIPLERKLQEITSSNIAQAKATDISVYVRDIESGQWIGIGEDKLYTPASMLKVPIIIAMLKIAQYNPDLLNKKIFYTRTEDDINPLDNKLLLENGKTYTIENLLEAMIVDSDDAAKKLIRDNVDRVVLNETFADLGIESPYSQDQDGKYSISAKSFSLFFRILYNSTFLSHANSQKVLELLTRTDFDLGIAGGIPKTVTVAHKYGISAISPVGNERVGLNDCGIVYAESGPYLICIMTKGKDPYVLASIMREISKQAYEFLVDNKP